MTVALGRAPFYSDRALPGDPTLSVREIVPQEFSSADGRREYRRQRASEASRDHANGARLQGASERACGEFEPEAQNT